MSRKVTIKDVAKEAEVSIATVSYVLNGREDQKISEKTRKKVLQVVALMNYYPNGNAKLMRSARTGNIAVIAICPNALYRAEVVLVLDALSAKAKERGRRLIYHRYSGAEAIANADAAVCINFSLEAFKKLGAENTIPLILADGFTDEPWCFQVNPDFSRIQGPGRLAVFFPENENLRNQILAAHPDAVFISHLNDLHNAPSLLFTHQRTLHELLKSSGKETAFIDDFAEKRLNMLFDCIDKALSHDEFEQHSFTI
ncbi:MAG: LacI family transcriptional regulator [Lachnospiraceae bacterium]|nr:LacI family transcriptional regulator [Lachnospiraceae bacterium]